MRAILFAFLLNLTCFATEMSGELLYRKCMVCHGFKAEKSYLNKVAPINSYTKEQLVTIFKEYKYEKRDIYQMGGVMKAQLSGISDENLEKLASYIKTLK